MKYTHRTAPKVEVEWIDSASHGGWGHLPGDKDHAPAKCKTTGYLLEKSRRQVAVAQNKGETRFGEVMVIPASCVKRVKRLR